jgi:Flp pilus assembly protein TadD
VPEDRGVVLDLASSLALAGRQDEALRRPRDVLPSIPSPRPVNLAVDLARVGDTAAARDVVKQAVALKEAGGSVPASGVAAAYAVLGDVPEALTWLEQSFEQEGGVYYLRSPDFATLWSQPRFRALWDRLGLPGDYPRPAPTE